jgi:exosortase/archaeosortase family protein
MSTKKDHTSHPATNESSKPNQSGFMQAINERKAILLPLAKYVGIILGFYLIWGSPWFQNNIVPGLTALNANLAGFFLNLFGENVNVSNSIISNGNDSVNVKSGCDGLEAMIICIAGVLVYPTKLRFKWPGIFFGLLFLFSLNLFRIITLYLTNEYWPAAFDIMHLDVWQFIFIVLAIITVVIWINWANKKENHA